MASLVIGVAGAFIAPTGYAALGFMIGSSLAGALFPPHGPNGPRLSDLKVQNSQYGNFIPIIYNDCRVAGEVIWSTNLIQHTNQTDSGSGGGGSTYYTYTVSFAVCVGEGPRQIKRIWADGKLIYDPANNFSHISASSLAFYPGDETQLPDPTIETALGPGNVPAYRGRCYMVFADMEVGKFGNRIPNLTFEVTPLTDADYMNLGQIVIDLSVRSGLEPAQINAVALDQSITGYCVSSLMPGKSALETLGSAYFFDPVESDGQIKFVLRGADPIVTIENNDLVANTSDN